MKKSFVLYLDQYEPIKNLTIEQKGLLFDAMFLYNCGKEINLNDPLLEMAFSFFKQTFDRDTEKWLRKAEKNRENGKKGGRPKKNDNSSLGKTHNNPENPDGFKETHNNPDKPKKAVSVNGSVSGSVTLVKELLLHFEAKIKENKFQKYESKFSEFIEYRKSIKKPLKSKQGITGFINLAKKLNDMNLDIEKCFDYTMGKEWQSPPVEFFNKNKKEFKREMESISICLAQDVWENSSYQAGGLYKTSEINYINFTPDFIDDDEREEIEINTARFVAEFCEGGF